MRQFAARRFVALVFWALSIFYSGARLMLDMIGYTTAPEDFVQLKQKLPDWLEWLFSTPWWVPSLLMAVITVFVIWVCWPRTESKLNQAPTLQSAPTEQAKNPVSRRKTRPIFGQPRQLAAEHYLSWWHIPIGVEGPGGSPTSEIRYCTAELLNANGLGKPMKLRWQADNQPTGVEETTLLEGVDRMIPLAIRCETGVQPARHLTPIRDGIARITGAAYLRDGNRDKFKLDVGSYNFRIRVKAGKKSWESPHIYKLRVGNPGESNGSFIIEARNV